MVEDTAVCNIPAGTVFQLVGAPSYFSHCVIAFLEREFHDHWIGSGGGGVNSLVPLFSRLYTLRFFSSEDLQKTSSVEKMCKV